MEPTTVVAVDIGGTKIACGLVTFTGEGVPVVESVERVPTNPLRGGKAVLADVIAAVKAACARSPRPVAGVGISTGGVVDPRTGDITYANEMMPGWSGTPLGTAVEEACGLPCRVLNDVHAHALGEARWGGGRGYGSVLVVAVGTGISGAIVDGGVLFLGAHDMAGNVGHMACEEAAGIECTCGAVGHLESVAAGPAIVGEYVRLSGTDADPEGNPVGGAYISRAAEEGDEAAVAAETRSGRALGGVLASSANLIDPEAIILSGSVVQCGPVWHDALASGYADRAMAPVRDLPVERGLLGDDAPLIGAAEHFVKDGYGDLS
ncbi:ROK family protein [Granulimonas faecalis]|uniref:ROK family protein n=1 Tax=Granulimonas faecalis TaxID=2894155 RepID=UPI003519336E